MNCVAAAIVVTLLGLPAGASAQSVESDPLEKAHAAYDEGDFAAAELAARTALGPATDDLVRAEAWRVLGLALFYQSRLVDAEAAFLEQLKIAPESFLDPALHSQDVVVFFQRVRAENQAELDKYRPKRDERKFIYTLAPPFGQFQNKHSRKGWILTGVGVSFAAASLGTYLTLRSWCNQQTNECGDNGDRNDDAKTVQAVNIGVTIALIATYAYGVFDGVRHYRRWKRQEQSLSGSLTGYVLPMPNGGSAGVSFRF